MSVSIWAYLPERCDGDVCVGDCDLCSKAQDNVAMMEGDSNASNASNALNVLKCVECLHWREYTGIRKEKTHICEIFDWFSKEEDFCSCAERKDGDRSG